jgi:hypothetical protein
MKPTMAQQSFELSTTASVDPAFAFRFLLDLNHHRHLRPHFVGAELVRSGTNACGQIFQEFRITERPRFALFRYTVNYLTRLVFSGPNEYTTDVNGALGTHVFNRMMVSGEQGATRIVEEVRIDAPRLTIGYLRQQAYLAHRRTFDRLPGVLETNYRLSK